MSQTTCSLGGRSKDATNGTRGYERSISGNATRAGAPSAGSNRSFHAAAWKTTTANQHQSWKCLPYFSVHKQMLRQGSRVYCKHTTPDRAEFGRWSRSVWGSCATFWIPPRDSDGCLRHRRSVRETHRDPAPVWRGPSRCESFSSHHERGMRVQQLPVCRFSVQLERSLTNH